MLHFSTALTAEAGNEGRLPSCHLPLFPPVLSYWRKWYTVITTHKTNVYTAYWLGKPLLDTQCRVLVKAWAKVPQWNIETPNLYLFYPTNQRLRCYYLGLSWWQRQERICLQCRGPRFDPWVGKISWRREWLPTLVFLPGKSHGQRSLVGYSPWGRKESDMTEQLHINKHTHIKFFFKKAGCWLLTIYQHATELSLINFSFW